MSAITVDGDLVHYEVLGRGRAVVLVHGWVGSWRYWIPTMQKLHLKYRVYAVDLFGFGDSARNPRKYTIEHQVNLLVEFLSQLGIKKAAMVGHGLGALVLTEFAQKHHDKIARLLITDAPLFDPGDLSTRVPPGQQVLLTPQNFDAGKAIENVHASLRGSPVEKTIPSVRAEDPAPAAPNDATIVNTRLIDRARLREAAMTRTSPSGTVPTPPTPPAPPTPSTPELPVARSTNTNPTDNPLFRSIGALDPETLLAKCFKRSEPNFDKLTQDVTKTDAQVVSKSANGFDAGRMLDILRALRLPVVIVHGSDDPLIAEPTEDVWSYITAEKEELLVPFPLPGVRHFPMLESDDFQQIVSGFLEQQEITNIAIKSRWRRRSR